MQAFRMYQTIRFNRPIGKNKDYISPGGYEIVVKDNDGNDRPIQFDFEDYEGSIDEEDPCVLNVMQKNPDYDTYPNLSALTREMLENIIQVKEWYIGLDYDEEEDLIPEEITDVCFVFPYHDWDEILNRFCIYASLLKFSGWSLKFP